MLLYQLVTDPLVFFLGVRMVTYCQQMVEKRISYLEKKLINLSKLIQYLHTSLNIKYDNIINANIIKPLSGLTD